MSAEATIAVATGSGALFSALFGLAIVMMCHWAQRHGRETSLELQFAPPRLRFYSGTCAEENSARRDGETTGEHHLPSPPNASLAPREDQRLRLLRGGRS